MIFLLITTNILINLLSPLNLYVYISSTVVPRVILLLIKIELVKTGFEINILFACFDTFYLKLN